MGAGHHHAVAAGHPGANRRDGASADTASD